MTTINRDLTALFFVLFLVSLNAETRPRFRFHCPKNVTAVDNVDVRELLGKWYEIERIQVTHEGLFQACTYMEFSLPEEEATSTTYSNGLRIKSIIKTIEFNFFSAFDPCFYIIRKIG